MANTSDVEVYGMMQTGTPLKSYKKTILGKVHVLVLNPFSGQPEGLILKGDPRKNEDACIVDIWNDKEDVYFKRANRRHFETGVMIPYTRKAAIEATEEEIINSMSDEEMSALLDGKFFTLQGKVNKMTAVAPVFRLLQIAQEKEKSQKITDFIKGKLAELQLEE
jgi:hypothetical protein